MRIPNYLRLAPSRVWHFRQVVPADLQAFFGRGTLMRSLRTTDLLTAQRRALEWAQQYAQAFATARGQGVAKDSMPTVEEIIRSAKRKKIEPYKMVRSPDGGIHLEANGKEDHQLMMDAWDRTQVEGIGPLSNESFVQQLPKEKTVTAKRAQVLGRPSGLPVTPPDGGISSPRSRTKDISAPSSSLRGGGVPISGSTLRGGVPPLAIGKAAVKWLENIKPDTLRKTFIIKSAAINGFVAFYGDKKPLNDVTRVKVGEWVDAMKAKGLTTPTLVNKTLYLKGFFEWAKARGLYVSDDNPAQGQVVYRTREKRARRAMGFKAFPASQVRILFHQDGFRHLSAAARWGAVVGLYTGMRVAEVGQLALGDFVEVDGVPCIRITNEGAGQSVKTDSSLRTIPIHPHLIELGLLKRVEALRDQGQKRLFPKIKLDVVNGAGNWLSTAFSRHITMSLAKPDKGKFGFHSLRKTLVQELQTLGVQSEIRAAYVGHELDDEHHATYSRAPTSRELFEAVSKLDWKLDLKALTEWLH